MNRHALFEQSDALQQRRDLDRLELRRRQLGKKPVRLHEAMQRIGAALHHAQAAAEIAHRGSSPCTWSTRASRLPAMDLMGASELESSWPRTRIRRFHAACSSSRRGRLTSASSSRVWGTPSWRNAALRSSQRVGLEPKE